MLRDAMFRDRIGGFDLKKIESETPTTVTVLLQEHTSDRFSRLVLEVEASEPHRIVSFDMHPVERPAEFALKPMTQAELIAALGKRLQEESRPTNSRVRCSSRKTASRSSPKPTASPTANVTSPTP